MAHAEVSFQQRQFAKRLRTAQTSLETAVWREFRAKRLDGWKFKRQAPIGPYVVDFICFERRLIVEVDGPLHEAAEQRLHDARRDAFLRRAGFRVLRLGEDAILRDLARVVDVSAKRWRRPLPQGSRKVDRRSQS